ncbi:hypothetical protein POSPLADRAFT_1143517 [Postia placenta MAD-698-R-SB12]|uniref:Enoyl reductase (ER) domain-containing protein n=1 Tax=Postia placenta MAD-698-R-SB12 TaxID=670580 RepID=A0A1X6N0P0_9APHY|nr:hypothetical protein POSPLADRAFT_1143517 [Postia placenta MAD-698-R-SB12]OSX62191.1 hypothetical protein POSPLADRAFT_1143517 [Postia placenta MAD-698-R-SB12]
MSPSHYTQIVLASRPADSAFIEADNFRKEVVPFDLKPQKGQVLIRVQYLSIDPATRLWLSETKTFLAPIPIGSVMQTIGIGAVIASGEDTSLVPGDLVSGDLDMAEYTIRDATAVQKLELPLNTQALDYIGPLGHIGLTAYFGLIDIAQIKAGETLVVSGAAGAIGSIVIGISGSTKKCEWLEQELGIDKALNYKSPTFKDDFSKAVGTLDVFYDNVGGEALDLALASMNLHARIIICGTILDINTAEQYPLRNYSQLLSKRATMRGFSLYDYTARLEEGRKYLTELVTKGAIKQRYHVLNGLDTAPGSLGILFRGENEGKLIFTLATDVQLHGSSDFPSANLNHYHHGRYIEVLDARTMSNINHVATRLGKLLHLAHQVPCAPKRARGR